MFSLRSKLTKQLEFMGFADDRRVNNMKKNKSIDNIGATVLSASNIPWIARNIILVKEAEVSYFLV